VRIKLLFLVLLIATLLFACSPSEAAIATTIVQTETAKPTLTFTPTLTNTPQPTASLTITPVPTRALPDVVQKTFSDAEIIHYVESFGSLPGFSPMDWIGIQKAYVGKDSSLEITGANNVVFYNGAPISANSAVVVGFKYKDRSNFTIGIDREENNSRIPYGQPGFRTFSAEFRAAPTVNLTTDKGHTRFVFKGNLQLHPDTWYLIALGFTSDKQFIMKIWAPENPEQSLTYNTQASGMPDQYYFILWVDANSAFYLKDFTIIKFSKLLLE
jgi:hypothetical protein